MEPTDESDIKREATADLGAINEARIAALKSTKRPMWVNRSLPLLVGTAFGFGVMGGVVGWTVFWVLLTAFGVLAIMDARRVRRRGRLIDGRSMGWRFLWIFAFGLILNFLGTVDLPAQQQPWFALATALFVAAFTYAFFRWEEVSMSKRLASGDFDPYTLF